MRNRRWTPGIRLAHQLVFVRCPRRVRRALRWHLLRGHGVALTQLALAAGAAVAPMLAMANPTGAQVVAGKVQVHSSVPTVLDIHQQSNLAIIHWQSFNIGAGETVNFVQPSLRSVALNRVLGNDPSAIFGRLNANGTVMLVNPNGVVFGAGSRVDVGGLVATTADIKDSDFLAGRYRFGQASPVAGAAVVNAGHISIKDSGLAALVAPRVANSGVIEAKLGRVALGGAQTFALDFQGDGLLSFSAGSAVDANGQPLVSNTGTLSAEGGSVLLTAQAVQRVVDTVINTDGVIEATSVGSHEGRIVLSGGSAGGVAVAGTVDASGRGTGEHGGTVQVTGQAVQVKRGTAIDASGDAGGGEIALGSRGVASGFADKSETARVAAGATLRADALRQGDGGSVTTWSKDTTVFAGSLSARGGAEGGDGGFAEVSSLKHIGLTGSVDLRAPKGATGQLLLDPTDLRITDSPSGGSQDGNAGDGQVAAGDPNQGADDTLNTISRGLLESMAGNANITLQATGQITVDAMAGGRIDLATAPGHSFTLQSTQSGGIRFADAQTEIRTQGGNITLEAQGIGSSLANIGKLTSNGGTVALRATGDIQLAGHIDAGSGAVQLQSTVGSITNGAGSPRLSGASVELSARGGQIGAAGNAIATTTPRLGIEAGGSIHAANSSALTDLSVNALHALAGSHGYQVSATGLDLRMTDGSVVSAERVVQAGGLNLALSSDRTLEVGTIDVGSGTATLSSRGGNLSGAAGNRVTAGSVKLGAEGSDGNNGAIGSASQAIHTATARLEATTGSGGAFVANTGALDLARLGATGASSVSATGSLTAGSVDAGSAALTLASTTGSVLDDGSAATRITAGALTVNAGGAVGGASLRLQTTATEFNADAASGGVHVHNAATSSTLADVRSGNGAIDITTGGSTTIGNLLSATSGAGNGITVAAAGAVTVNGAVNAGSQGDVQLSTTHGAISDGSSSLVTGHTVSLSATSGVSARTAASTLQVQAGAGNVTLVQAGSVSVEQIATTGSTVTLTATDGDITVGAVQSGLSGRVSLSATDGSILDDGDAGTRIQAKTVALDSAGSIGDASHAVQTKATELSVAGAGDLYVSNDSTLTSLGVDHRHATPGQAATLQITSPYLTFQVGDNGSAYAVERLVGVPLTDLSFQGDQTLVVGQVQGAGSVSLVATQGDIRDDGNAQSRITAGGRLSLQATQGSLGSATTALDVNASQLVLATHGDLYLRSLADLSSLAISSTHADATTSYGMAISAPSLNFSVTDSAAGHHVHTLTDTSSLSLEFASDRDITLGRVDVSDSGSASFTSTGGSILDDGDKSTRVLADSTTLSGAAVGASGNGHLDVVTSQLSATATAGGVYIEVPMPAGSSNTTSTLTLGSVTAAGPVEIRALEGDVSLGGVITATDQAVSLSAQRGSILSPSGYFGYTGGFRIGSGSLTLNAAQSIGTEGRAVWFDGEGASLQAQAGTSMFLTAGNATTLASLQAGSGITYTQNSGTVTVGHVDATAGGTVSITAASGAIEDDGNGATGVSAGQVSLAASTDIGSAGRAVAVATPSLALSANGTVNVADSVTLQSLSLTRGSGSTGSIAITAGAGQSFTITEDASEHLLQAVSSGTPLDFSFSGQRTVKVSDLDVGAAGSVTIASATSVVDDGQAGTGIAAGTVSLTAGTAGSIGASGSGNAISLEGTTSLALSAGRDIFASSDTSLTDLSIASTSAGGSSQFGVVAQGQTFGITDNGSTQSLDFSGNALGNFSFSNHKNIQVGTINATGDVTLVTRNGGANSNISSDGGSGRIAGGRVLLTAASNTANGGSIGSSGTALRVDTPSLILDGSANVYVNDAQDLSLLDMTLTHGTNTTFGYGVTATNINSFSVTDGSTQALGLAVSNAIDFRYSVDRALILGTIDAGTSSVGAISLTSRSAPTGTNAQINRASGTLVAGSVTLSAIGSNGGVGATGTISTGTQNLSIASGGNVSVSNSTTLNSLSLEALHRTSGSNTHTYGLSSTGLTFSVTDNTGTDGLHLNNIAQSGLDLTVKSDRTITASAVNTGVGGKVTLDSNTIRGGSGASAGNPSISTGDLTLLGYSAHGSSGGALYTAAQTLSSTLSGSLELSNSGDLTLRHNSVGSSAVVASSNGSLRQEAGGLFTAPTLTLKAQQSLAGGGGNTLATNARQLKLESGGDIDVANVTDLYTLELVSNHATPGAQNTISVQADRLNLTLTDSVAGDQYHLAQLTDSSGLDFTLRTDVALALGAVDVHDGRSLGLYSTGAGTSITNDGSSLLKAGDITLSATGSVGAAGDGTTRMQTDALGVRLITGGNAYLDNAQDLSNLSLTSNQSTGGTAPVYEVTAPSLSFALSDDGTTHLDQVVDSTGLNFVLDTRRSQAIGVVDVGPSGSVSLKSAGDIHGDADSSKRLTAASVTLQTSQGGDVGSVANPIHLSAPLATFRVTGALNVESDTHIDSLTVHTTHPTATYGGTYSIVSVPVTGATPYALFTATDDATGTELTQVSDPEGLAFTYSSDRDIKVVTLDLGSTGTVALTSGGSIVGDGDANTLIQAAGLKLNADGAIGGAGAGNAIDAKVGTLDARADGGAVKLALHGATTIGSLYGSDGVGLVNAVGDIHLGSIDAGGDTVDIDNQGGSILGGSINRSTTVILRAAGSIGNQSAIRTTANGGGTTTLTAEASAANGADGSVAVTESYNLSAVAVTAPAAVTLEAGRALSVGTVDSGGAVSLKASQGNLTGVDGSNSISGTSVSLAASYNGSIGTSGTRLNVDTTALDLKAPGNVYISGQADLDSLSIDRSNSSSGSFSSGALSVTATHLTLNASDSGNTTTFTTLIDSTGLDFSYLGIGSINVGTVDVGSGSALLRASLYQGDGHIRAVDGSSSITAGALTLQANGAASAIGSSGTALGMAVDSLTASSGTGGLYVRQAGSLSLSDLNTTGNLSVNATAGDLTLGNLSWGGTLDLNAAAGSILAGGGALAGKSSTASVTLSAANGIGTELAPVLVNGAQGHAVSASVTGTGSLYLASVAKLNGGLTTSVNNGATSISAADDIRLASLTSNTDAEGNDIRVVATAGNITAVSVSAGGGDARHAEVDLSANAGSILATSSSTLQGAGIRLHGTAGVGSASQRVIANSSGSVQVSSTGGDIYLGTAGPSVLTNISSAGGDIDIASAKDLLIANASSGGGDIKVAGTANDVALSAGNIDAGAGSVTLASTSDGGRLLDDGDATTRIRGATVTLNGKAGVGAESARLQTAAGTLDASSGNGIYLADQNAAGVTLRSVVASDGAVSITTAGPTTATLVKAETDGAGKDVSISTSSGNLTLGAVTAGATQGRVLLAAAGSILGSGGGAQVSAHGVSLSAGADIGTVTDPATGAGSPVTLDVDVIEALGTTGSHRVVSVEHVGTDALTLGSGMLSLGSGSSVYIKAGGDLDATASLGSTSGTLSLTSGGTLTLPDAAFVSAGAVRLVGATDVVTSGSGDAARNLRVNSSSLTLRSGAAGGDTLLTTAVGAVDAELQGAGDLTLLNTGTVAAATLKTSDGDITATSSNGLVVDSAVAGGSERQVALTATGGDLKVGTISAGTDGSLLLTSSAGSILGDAAVLVGQSLALSSATGIGSSTAAFNTDIGHVSAEVTGSGDIHLASAGTLHLGRLATQDGDIAVRATGDVNTTTLSAGQGGSVTLASSHGNVLLTQALALDGGALLIDGNAALVGGAHSLATGGGALRITGALIGGDEAATLDAGSGAVSLEGAVSNLASLTVTGGSIRTAGVSTDGAQTYHGSTTLNGAHATQGGAFTVDGATTLGSATTVATAGGDASFKGGVDGAADLSVSTGAGNTRFSGAVGQTARVGQLTVDTAGTTTFSGAVAAASVATDAAGTLVLDGGSVNTTGAQRYGEHVTLGTHTTLTGQGVAFAGDIDGNANLTVNSGTGAASFGGEIGAATRIGHLSVNSAGATSFDGTVSAASVTTDAAGTLAINGGSIDTTGTQTYGERAVLGANTVLKGSTVTLAGGADGSSPGAQSLAIVGNAVIGGAVGAQNALASLSISGSTALEGASVTTTGHQQYGGAVQVNGNSSLRSTGGSLNFASTIDSPNGANLSITSDAGAVAVAGAVGSTGAPGVLTVHAATTLDFSGSVRAYEINTSGTSGLTRFGGSVQADGPGGINVSGASIEFQQAVTASQGALKVVNTSPTGTLSFAPEASVYAATGFTQSGGAAITLPARVYVERGPITLEAPATLPSGDALIETEGDITITGLHGPATNLTLATGHGPAVSPGAGALRVGLPDDNPAHKLDVLSLTVPDAASARLYGSIDGRTGAAAASLIKTSLWGSPYFMNDAAWAPPLLVYQPLVTGLTAITVRRSVVPSTPLLDQLFAGEPSSEGIAANALDVYLAPEVLTVREAGEPATPAKP